jgi:cytochrome b
VTDPAAGVRVWDPLIRVCHWLLVLSVALAWFTREGGGAWHEWIGYATLLLVACRAVWGWMGPGPARFSRFVQSPAATTRYARLLLSRSEPRYLGHNPLGGWMILFLLAAVAAAGITGWLYTTDAYWGDAGMERLHYLCAIALLALIGLHVVGVAVTSLLQRENLAAAMVHGRKRAPKGDDIAA